MIRKLAPIYSSAWRTALVLLSVQIAAVSILRYVAGAEPAPPPIVANAFANPFLVIHVVSAVIALLVAPLQFVRAIRTRWPALHRGTGKVYIVACAFAAPSGFILALGTVAGPVAAVGFAVPGVLCALFTWWGWRAALDRRFKDHRDWMLRSYAMISAAITLRLLLPASAMLGFGFYEAYPIIAWLSWSINWALVEYFIRRERGPARGRPTFATA